VRFVVGPEATIVPDVAGRLPGRGIWVGADAATLRTAVEKGLFSRAAKARVTVPDDLAYVVERALVQRLLEALALARKAGAAVAGREKTREALASGQAALLLQAADGSVRERRELRPPAGPESRFECLAADELGMAFGRDRVIHAAVLAGGLADRVRDEALRLSGIRHEFDRQPCGHGAGEDVAGEGSRGKG
jgi:predicted RNA-binding protein YlxR (DUF448 family)